MFPTAMSSLPFCDDRPYALGHRGAGAAEAGPLDDPLDREVAAAGIADVADHAEPLLLGGRLEDEVPVAEDPAEERLVHRDVEDSGDRHGGDLAGDHAADPEHPHVGDHEAVHVLV